MVPGLLSFPEGERKIFWEKAGSDEIANAAKTINTNNCFFIMHPNIS
jgi:hypothetical protein